VTRSWTPFPGLSRLLDIDKYLQGVGSHFWFHFWIKLFQLWLDNLNNKAIGFSLSFFSLVYSALLISLMIACVSSELLIRDIIKLILNQLCDSQMNSVRSISPPFAWDLILIRQLCVPQTHRLEVLIPLTELEVISWIL